MTTTKAVQITIESTVNVPVEKVWDYWSKPEHIVKWNNPSDDWHTTHAENDLRVGGRFLSHMAAKDGSFAFDFDGTYDKVDQYKIIEYTLSDGRKVSVLFSSEGKGTKVVETFEAETMNSIEMQRGGWQAILDNFKKYTEEN